MDRQTPRAFDFEGSRWPPQFHYTGPFHDGAGRAGVVLGEPGCAQEKEEGETPLGLGGEQDFSPDEEKRMFTRIGRRGGVRIFQDLVIRAGHWGGG